MAIYPKGERGNSDSHLSLTCILLKHKQIRPCRVSVCKDTFNVTLQVRPAEQRIVDTVAGAGTERFFQGCSRLDYRSTP
jgi:hypothetical protein